MGLFYFHRDQLGEYKRESRLTIGDQLPRGRTSRGVAGPCWCEGAPGGLAVVELDGADPHTDGVAAPRGRDHNGPLHRHVVVSGGGPQLGWEVFKERNP